MICFPNAKINIGLHVTSRRSDGYHNIETIFYPAGLKDILEFVVSDGVTNLNCTGIMPGIDLNENIVLKAYSLIRKDYPNLPEINIHLHKIIPAGAGLGGGSADAVFMLKMLNDHFDLKLNFIQLNEYALKLGSDCPFFLINKPCYATGRGDIFEELEMSLKGKFIIIIYPDLLVSTSEAYRNVFPFTSSVSLKELIKKPVSEWKGSVVNDFEQTVFERYPEIKNLKEMLYRKGAEFALMSGSGSSVYGIFDDTTDTGNIPLNYFSWKGWL